MALIEVCGKLIDTNVKFMGKPALDYSEIALKKELEKRKEEENRKENPTISIEISQEYYSLKQEKSALVLKDNTSKNVDKIDFSYYKRDIKIDIFA
ncbi:hypothetical protein [Campylobacter avium]|uniref:hypothetical protein n=1 Tax=Campylobacter avium TaxID=522485 RepID=UPI00255C2329|nr:hypothetical protein [Campylobacter avium]